MLQMPSMKFENHDTFAYKMSYIRALYKMSIKNWYPLNC